MFHLGGADDDELAYKSEKLMPRRFYLFGVCLVAALVPLGLTISSAASAEDQAEQAPPALAFLDVRPLKADYGALLQGKKVQVEIRNNRGRRQRIQLRLVGLSLPSGEELPDVGPVDKVLKRRSTAVFDVPLPASKNDRPEKAGAYTGVLVATGSGDVVRRDFTLEVADPKAADTTTRHPAPALQPKTISDFSVQATNYLPSLISPLPSALFGLGVLLLIGAVIAGLGQFTWHDHVRDAGLLLGALCIGAWAVLTFGRDGPEFDVRGLVLAILGVLVAAIASGSSVTGRGSYPP